MAKIGVLIETEKDEIKKTNFGTITAVRDGGKNEVVALLLGVDANSAQETLAAYGAQKIVQVTVDGADLLSSPDLQARALVDVIHHFALDGLIGLASARGRDVFARLSALLNVTLVSDCVGVNFDDKTVRKSHFSGKTMATIKLNSDLLLCALRPNAIEAEKAPTDSQVENYAAAAEDPGLVKILEIKKGDTRKMDLTEADVIITGGRPIDAAENYKMLDECADQLGAAVGASRAAVDAGFAPHSMQVGQTGKTVSPRLYIGCGLSGSVQHFAGMKTSKVIVAINTDKDAPIFQKSDYGIIGDIFEVVPVLTEILREQASQ
ncbi:MAG: electron transfer flavoprotein subunit alpha/FixB family protein [Desulfobacterales bacterium]|nr:electron transfer flavoprotein subunit alpha/FixB family protein [Desulfobacterales bacterium]